MESEKMASWRTGGPGLSIDTEFVAAASSGGQSDNGGSDSLEDCLSQEGSGRFLSPMASSAMTSARDMEDAEDCPAATCSDHEEAVRRDSPVSMRQSVPEEALPVEDQADPVSESSYEEYSEEEEDLAEDPSLASFTSRLGRFQSGTSLSASPPVQRGNSDIERELAALSASRPTNTRLELAGLSASRSCLAPNPNVAVSPRALDMDGCLVKEWVDCLSKETVAVEDCRAKECDVVDSSPEAASPVAMEDFASCGGCISSASFLQWQLRQLDETDAPVAHLDTHTPPHEDALTTCGLKIHQLDMTDAPVAHRDTHTPPHEDALTTCGLKIHELDMTDAPVAHRDSLVSITSLSNMRSGMHREPLMTPKDQCDSARSSMLSVASPCRSSPRKGGRGSPAKVADSARSSMLSVASPCRSSPRKRGCGSPAKVALADRGSIEELDMPMHRDSLASITSLSNMRTALHKEVLTPSSQHGHDSSMLFVASPSSPTKYGSPSKVHSPLPESSISADHGGSLVFKSDMRQLLSPQSVGSVCSLRYMKSAMERPEATGTPNSQEFNPMLSIASPCRSSPTRSASGSPTANRLGFRRSDISDRRASASFRSDIQHLMSPRKGLTRDSSPRHPNALAPVSETDEAATGPSAPPALRRARESHPLLFSPPVLEPQAAVPDAALPDAAEPRRTSTQRRCLELQLDQCEEQLRQEKQICREKDEALQEEQLRRAAAEMELQERSRNARQQEQRLLEGQRAFATESRQGEQRLLESQGALEARTRQDEQSLLDSRRALEQEMLCFSIERENAEEDRRNFLLHHVHEADAALIKRERELCEKVRELDAQREQLEEDMQEVGAEKAALTTAGLHLAESAAKLTEREERVTLRERRHAATIDRASQTPVFRAGNVRLSFCRRACSFVVKVLIFLAILAPALFLAHGHGTGTALPQLWNDLRLHAGSAFSGIGGALRQNGLVRECPPCVQCPRGPRWPVVWHPPRRLASVPAASPPTNSVVDAATMGGLGAALVYLKGP